LPNKNSSITLNNIKITNCEQTSLYGIVINELEIINIDDENDDGKFKVNYIDYSDSQYWLDVDLPSNNKSFINLINLYLKLINSNESLTLVHSKNAGNRCALFIATTYLIYRINVHNKFDVPLVVYLLRKFRENMISSYEQYKYLYELCSENVINNNILNNDNDNDQSEQSNLDTQVINYENA
jgi:protein tyrosine phosphatase